VAQKSKKSLIAAAALPLFLENGFKGTSIDMVVKNSQVSKATVYNHYYDKSALMLATLALWVEANKPLIAPLQGAGDFDDFLHRHWLTPESVRMYALVIGEGWRFPDARKLFWEKFDRLWRKALHYLSNTASDVEPAELEMRLDHHLLQRLKQLNNS
jgi:AcrR family transcriptional regulator